MIKSFRTITTELVPRHMEQLSRNKVVDDGAVFDGRKDDFSVVPGLQMAEEEKR